MKALCLLLWLVSAAFFGLCDSRSLAAAEPAQVRKVVRQYALTSANDFPQRDPRDWRLLGSNDGGQTWISLDRRKGEIFSERHQRRVFTLPTAPRLICTACKLTACVILQGPTRCNWLKLRPWEIPKEDVDSTPTAVDVITAQGAKFPMETLTTPLMAKSKPNG